MFIETIKFLKEIFKNNYKTALVGLLLTPIFFYSIAAVFGVSIKDHLTYLVEKSYAAEREKLANQLAEINREIGETEIQSHEKQKILWKLLEKGLAGSEHSEALGIANRNQDALRALLEFGKIYIALVEADAHTKNTHLLLTGMYRSLIYIIKDSTTELEIAYDTLNEVNQKIGQFPDVIRDEVQIEVLRYLSYCSARLVRSSDHEVFNNQAQVVKKNMMKRSAASPAQYRRKFYWVDLSQLVSLFNSGHFKQAEEVFYTLRNSLSDTEFLKTKILQHEKLIKKEFREEWKKYIVKL